MSTQSSKFAYDMNASAFTDNGAVSLTTPDPSRKSSGRVALFFKSVRGLNIPSIYQYMVESNQESTVDSFLLAFHIRDCRGGKGERELGRRALIWLFINQPHLFENIIKLIPEYGRWDDLLQFFPVVLNLENIDRVQANYMSIVPTHDHLLFLQLIQTKVVTFFADKIKEDHAFMLAGKPCSLAAKWAPTEGDSIDRASGVFNLLASEMKVSSRVLRKTYLTPLRYYLKIVERYMCDREWTEIDYNKVPSCAMKRLKKSFENHDETRFREWRDALQNGDPKVAKVNAKQLHPHELVKEMRTKGCADAVCEAQWKVMEEECMKNGSLDDDIVVVDTSASMNSSNCQPLDVACAMGLLIAKCSKGKFANHVISFNDNPRFHVLKDGPIYNRYSQLNNIDWGGSTNLQATFRMILERGKACSLKQDDMPKRLWIISDMQFNKVCGCNILTNFEAIDKMYAESGYTRPQIVFWNVSGSSHDFPVSVGDYGTALISGFSSSVMKAVLEGDYSFSPYGIMRKTLDSDRFLPVRQALIKDICVVPVPVYIDDMKKND
jgi:hypothetical protein